MTRQRGHSIAAAAVLGLVSLAVVPIAAQTPGDVTAFASEQYRYAVALPGGCRQVQGPGTTDAVCSPDFDPQKSAVASAAGALVLSVMAEAVARGGDTTVAGLLQRYTEAGFKEELPDSVCGESDKARVRIENLKQAVEAGRVVYTADVRCAAVRFLQIGPRRAAVRHVIGPDTVYRLLARAPVEDFEKRRGAIDAFFASFRILPSEQGQQQAGK